MNHKNVKKLQSVHLHPTTPLKLTVWWVRRFIRDIFGKDILDTSGHTNTRTQKVRHVYLKVDDFIKKYLPHLEKSTPRTVARKRVYDVLHLDLGYDFADVDMKKPWGAYYRIVDEQADRFLAEFFPGLSAKEAKLGRDDVQLSPKIMLVYPGERLSWQYHHRRAERWRFLTKGGYYKSTSDKPGKINQARAGEIVQFATSERHRLCAADDAYTLVAEIWQHIDPAELSDEADIVRLHDDYKR